MSLEIERKFLLKEFPEQLIKEGQLKVISEQVIDQTYIAMDEDQELRVRKIVDKLSGDVTYTHTFKNGNGLVREEVEYSISGEIYEQIFSAFNFTPLIKTRTTAQWEGITVEMDQYHQIDFIVLEVEFTSEQEAAEFHIPYWFGEDISSNRQFSNKTVWRELQRNNNSHDLHI
ncbi:CYTH domain-containing protein [Fontibacillus panacisegetis]|uniref:CYTH domain-containing protein n=1 Tax=Fontibacillus panacisegetis TaxID=670482 RepID=A0A1G7J8A5_9BACL|nr:CYTH domain-containing protein [Fontibacillus panacisegetis]SDF21141.1 CYTH domain-containing protein [Fontibacillus panacisegetis]